VISPLHFRLVGSNWFRDGYTSDIDREYKEAVAENDMHLRNEEKRNAKELNISQI